METRMYFQLHSLKRQLTNVCVHGIASVSRAVISEGKENYEVLVEYDNVRDVMTVPGVDGERLKCNHIIAVAETRLVLNGKEAGVVRKCAPNFRKYLTI